MRITIASPLYPPDLGHFSWYVKALGAHLCREGEQRIRIVAYSDYPELTDGVRIVPVSKQLPIFFRICVFAWRIWRETKGSRLLLVSDGVAVGIPSVIVGRLRRIPIVRFVWADETAERIAYASAKISTNKLAFIRAIQSWVLTCSKGILVSSEALKMQFIAQTQLPHSRFHYLSYPSKPQPFYPVSIDPDSEQHHKQMKEVEAKEWEAHILALTRFADEMTMPRL